VIGPVAQRRQRRRRPRIAYATKPNTIRIISTHNHPGMAASLVGAAAVRGDATASHPGNNSPTAADLGGDWRATPGAGSRGIPAPCDLPADLAWPGRAATDGRLRLLGVGLPATPPGGRGAGREARP
jgi:hypothetical protein